MSQDHIRPSEVTPYDLMRFVSAGVGSSVVGTGLKLSQILATGTGISLVFEGHRERVYLDVRQS